MWQPCRPRARSASSTTACSPDPRRRRALVPRSRRAARRRRSRGHVPDAASVGRGVDPPNAGSAGRRLGPRMALYAGGRAGGSSRRSCSAPAFSGTSRATAAPTTSSTPARSRTSRCSPPGCCARRRLPAGRRLVRAVDARVLARVPRAASRAAGVRAAAVHARPRSARSASRACTATACWARGYAAPVTYSRACTRAPDAAGAAPGRAAGRCSPGATSPRSGCPRWSRRSRWRARAIPSCAARSSATGPSARGARGDRADGLDGVVVAPGFVGRRRGRGRSARGRCAWCCRRGARATAWWSSRPPRAGRRASSCAAPDNAAVELVEDGVNGFIAASPSPSDLAAAIVRVHAAARRCARRTREWFARNAPAAVARRLARRGRCELRAARS